MSEDSGELSKNISGQITTERPRLRLTKRDAKSEPRATNFGQQFWELLSPEVQAIIEQPIRNIEQSVARRFSEGYSSPLVTSTATLPVDQLERQSDSTSCTYVSTANALRVLDQPLPEYSKDALKTRIDQITGQSNTTLNSSKIEEIFNSGAPYDQFQLRKFEQARIRMPGIHPETMDIFRALESGDVAVASWRMSPTTERTRIQHARTIVGFSKGSNETITLHVIDPYGARQETWSFKDWVIASRMNTVFNSPVYEIEDIRRVAEVIAGKGGMMAAVASEVEVIHKKRPQIVIKHSR